MRRFFITVLCLGAQLALAQEFSQRYELVNLGKDVNTFYHEAAPVISRDGKDLYFFVQNHPENTYGKDGSQDIWVTHLDDKGVWSPPKRLGPPFNKNRSNQVFSVLPDGSLFVRGGRGSDSGGFSIVSPSGNWDEIRVKDYADMERGRFNGAAISSDAKHMILYFTEVPKSIRSDLYVSNLQPNGEWSRPVKLNITGSADEFGPFIGPNDKILYFASDMPGEGRQGGTDIYKSERLDDTWQKWSKPVNLGSPINTSAGDAYFSIDEAGNVFTSRANSRVDGGNLDIFTLVPKDIKVIVKGTVYDGKTQIPMVADVDLMVAKADPVTLKTTAAGQFEKQIQEANAFTLSASAAGYQPYKSSYTIPPLVNDTTIVVDVYLNPIPKKLVLSGLVMDERTDQPINAQVEIKLKTDRRLDERVAAPQGNYQQPIDKMGWYMLTASAEGYLTTSDSVLIENEDINPVVKDLRLKKIEVGLTVRLKNIYFDFDKTTLKSESYVELNKVVDFLKQNNTVEIEISGHTDSKGSDEYNLNLSQGRSQAVVDYLVSQGIEAFRLTAHGYGETKPIDTNDTDEGRANNRRVEFTVLKT